jgi:hypothetical protein
MESFIKTQVLRNEIEAQMMDEALTQQGIPHRIRSYHDSAYDGLFQMAAGWGHIEAPAALKDEIRAIYEELTSGEGRQC